MERLTQWVLGLAGATCLLAFLWAAVGLFVGVAIRAAQWVIAL